MKNNLLFKFWICCLLGLGLAGCKGNHSDEPAPGANLIPSAATANFTTNIQLADINQTVIFTNQSTDAARYTWYYGDGDSSKAINGSHKYLYPGQYSVILKAFDNQGIPSVKYGSISVGERYIEALEINKLKFTDAAGNPWDYGTWPDIWLGFGRIRMGNGYGSNRVKNNLNPGQIPYTHPFEMAPFLNENYKIVISDFDSSSNFTYTSQEMASWIVNPVKATQWDSVNNTGFIELKNNDFEIRLKLKLKLK